jgi:hypothetical protein
MTETVGKLDANYALGMFVSAWSELEITLELVIAQELKLDGANLSTVMDQKNFISRMNILKSFLEENEDKNKEKIELLEYKYSFYKGDEWVFGKPIVEDGKIIFITGFDADKNAPLVRLFAPIDLALSSRSIAVDASELMIVFGVDSSLRQEYFCGLTSSQIHNSL